MIAPVMPLIATKMTDTNLIVVDYASSLASGSELACKEQLNSSGFEDEEEFDYSEDELLAALDSLEDDHFPDMMTSGFMTDFIVEPMMKSDFVEKPCCMASDNLFVAEIDKNPHESEPNQISFRQAAIARWMDKRKRRTFRKKVVCKARGEVAQSRPRVGGRFVKSQSPGWVAITSL